MVDVKTWDINKDIAEDVKTRFNASYFKLDKELHGGQLVGQTMKKTRWIKSKNKELFKTEQ